MRVKNKSLSNRVKCLQAMFLKLHADTTSSKESAPKKYDDAVKICEKLLRLKLCLEHFVHKIRNLGLNDYLYSLIDVLPSDLALRIIYDEDAGANNDCDLDTDNECEKKKNYAKKYNENK